jgi:thiamine monophosphate kinase
MAAARAVTVLVHGLWTHGLLMVPQRLPGREYYYDFVRVGDGLAAVFKIESHNHPSFIEPYQGAATGVGGILRDIFTMGARPIAVLDALRFGDPADARTRHLVDGVVRGVGGYGNCVGVPTVGGELVFDPSYTGNPLVNVMAIGLLEERLLTLAAAPGPGNLVVLYGSATGRDGIGGASVLASATFTDDDPSKRPSVQVGDPFAEKLLIEASLELIERGLVEGLQDLGAGGITCATSETADRAGTGIVVDLDAIPRREPGLEPLVDREVMRRLAIRRDDLGGHQVRRVGRRGRVIAKQCLQYRRRRIDDLIKTESGPRSARHFFGFHDDLAGGQQAAFIVGNLIQQTTARQGCRRTEAKEDDIDSKVHSSRVNTTSRPEALKKKS